MRPVPETVSSILVIKLSSLGDVLLGTAILPALAGRWPGAAIDWVVEPEGAALLDNNPFIRQPLLFRRREMAALVLRHPLRALRLWREFRRRLRECEYDLVVDIQGLAKSWLVLRQARLAPRGLRIGKGRFIGLDIASPHRRGFRRHAVPSYFEPLESLLPSLPDAAGMRPVFVPAESARAELEDLLHGEQPRARHVVLHPWTTWATKHWPEEHWVTLGRALLGEGLVPVISGAERDAAHSAALAERIGRGQGGRGAIVAAGRLSFAGFAHLARQALAVISVDSLPMHLAAVVGARVVALHGPTDPVRTGPWGRRALACNAAGVFLSTAGSGEASGTGMRQDGPFRGEGGEGIIRLVRADEGPPWPVAGMNCPKMPCLSKTCPRYKTECMHILTPEKVLAVLAWID